MTALLALNRLPGLADGDWLGPILGALAFLCLAGFLRQEHRVTAPIIQLRLFRDLGFAGFSVATLIINLAGFAPLLLGPYYLVRTTSLPIALGLLAMMYPVLAKVRYGQIGSVTRDRRMLVSSLVLNRVVGPSDDDARAADVVVTMGCGGTCPFFAGRRSLDRELQEPAGLPVEQVRPIVDDIDRRVRALLSELVPGGV